MKTINIIPIILFAISSLTSAHEGDIEQAISYAMMAFMAFMMALMIMCNESED